MSTNVKNLPWIKAHILEMKADLNALLPRILYSSYIEILLFCYLFENCSTLHKEITTFCGSKRNLKLYSISVHLLSSDSISNVNINDLKCQNCSAPCAEY